MHRRIVRKKWAAPILDGLVDDRLIVLIGAAIVVEMIDSSDG